MFRALELTIGSAVAGKDVGLREEVGDDLDSFFEPNFRKIEGVFMLGGFAWKDAAGERSSVAILEGFVWKVQTKATVLKSQGGSYVRLEVFVPWFYFDSLTINSQTAIFIFAHCLISCLPPSLPAWSDRIERSLISTQPRVWPPVRSSQCVQRDEGPERSTRCVELRCERKGAVGGLVSQASAHSRPKTGAEAAQEAGEGRRS